MQSGRLLCKRYEPMWLVSANFLGHQLQHFIVLRETIRFQLGEHRAAVDDDLEAATITWLECDF
jgi:hypothetical protein